jgi:hypothetical protein
MQFSLGFLKALIYTALILSTIGAVTLLVMLFFDLRGKRMW